MQAVELIIDDICNPIIIIDAKQKIIFSNKSYNKIILLKNKIIFLIGAKQLIHSVILKTPKKQS